MDRHSAQAGGMRPRPWQTRADVGSRSADGCQGMLLAHAPSARVVPRSVVFSTCSGVTMSTSSEEGRRSGGRSSAHTSASNLGIGGDLPTHVDFAAAKEEANLVVNELGGLRRASRRFNGATPPTIRQQPSGRKWVHTAPAMNLRWRRDHHLPLPARCGRSPGIAAQRGACGYWESACFVA
jgi:hypothetical protein